MKRFFSEVSVAARNGGYALLLNGKPVRTPGKAIFHAPCRAVAEAAAAEWRRQGERLDPATMPVTRLVNTLIDRVTPRCEEVAGEIAAYAETDLLCHRATAPADLIARQARLWDPPLDRLAERHRIRLAVTSGILPAAHDAAALAALRELVGGFDPPHLLGLYLATTASGSVVLGLALVEGDMEAQAVFEASILDEAWQAERWGEDGEAARRRASIRRDLEDVALWISLLARRDALSESPSPS